MKSSYGGNMYNTVIFDLDDTLTDDEENIREAFRILNKNLNEEYSQEKFSKFYKIDRQTWKDRAEGRLITPFENDKDKKAEWLRAYRFLKYYDNQISYDEAVNRNNIYMNALKEHIVPQEGAYNIVKYLYEKGYKIVIATNGPILPLATKIKKLEIESYIDTIFSGEEVGYMKPNKEFYQALFKKANISSDDEVIFIGDELEQDMKGGIENNLDTCWYNFRNNINNKYKVKYEIHKLEELKNIL